MVRRRARGAAGLTGAGLTEARARGRSTPTPGLPAGGAADEITLAANRAAWVAHWLQPRRLRASAQGTRVELPFTACTPRT